MSERGRPFNKNRQLAIDLGFPTYEGTPHKACGTTTRYTSGGSCVHCARAVAAEQREARKYLKHREREEAKALDNAETAPVDDEADAEARRQASIDELM